jgi:aconitase A
MKWWFVRRRYVKQGSKARVEPEGEVMRMWEAIETYMNRKQPLIIIAGKGLWSRF